MAITYGPSSNLQNFMDQLDQIKSAGNYNLPMKLPPPPVVTPIAMKGLQGTTSAATPRPGTSASPTPYSSPSGGTDALSRLMRAIRQQESGGNYGARNSLYGAAGGYQILPSNFTQTGSGWDMEALGHDVSLDQFMNSPQIQDSIARYKLAQYLKQFGSPAAAAVAWYGGPGAVKHMYDQTKQAGGYPSLYEYWKSVLAKM